MHNPPFLTAWTCAPWRVCLSSALPRPVPCVRYTWEIYARRLLDLSSVYSFWKHVSNLERSETKRYLEMLYVLRLRPLIEKVDCVCVFRGRGRSRLTRHVGAVIHVGGAAALQPCGMGQRCLFSVVLWLLN